MYGEELKGVIEEYLRDSRAEYAVMIDGDWGSGKTYFLTHSLMDIIQNIDNGKSKPRKYAKTLMNCNDIIINMGNDVVKDVRQQYTAMRYLGILGMLFDNQYEVAMTHLKEASYQYDSASMNSGVTTCKLFMCLVEIDKCRKEKVGINLREKVEVLLNDIVQSAWNNRRNRLLKYIIMLYVKVYEKKFR